MSDSKAGNVFIQNPHVIGSCNILSSSVKLFLTIFIHLVNCRVFMDFGRFGPSFVQILQIYFLFSPYGCVYGGAECRGGSGDSRRASIKLIVGFWGLRVVNEIARGLGAIELMLGCGLVQWP